MVTGAKTEKADWPDPQKNKIQLVTIATDIHYIKRDLEEIKQELTGRYVTQEEFDPIKRVVYGLIGLILVSFVGSVIALVIK